jgi:hypothetical protein
MTALVFVAGAAMLGTPMIAAADAGAPSSQTTTVGVDQSVPTPAPAASPSSKPQTLTPNEPSAGAGDIPRSDEPPQGSNQPKTGKRPQDLKFEHIEIEPTLVETISTGSDVHQPGGAPNALPYDLLRLTGQARYRFNKHFAIQYQRIAHTGSAGRNYKNGKASYGGSGYDYEERELAVWTFSPLLNVRAGYHYRARVCCAGAGDPNAIPRFLGGFMTDVTWRTFKPGLGGRPLSLNFRYEQNDHRFSEAAQANLVRGDYDSGQKPTFSISGYANFYIYHQTKLVPYVGEEYYSTYFSNSPHMSITNRKVYGAAYAISNDATLRAFVKNDQNVGNIGGDVSHKSYMQIELSYRFHH